MRDSNYKSISTNKAAVTITTSLYDRRALDVTSDKPLVNSLNYLTYLVSSSAKVRETLSVDGGIERLIEILHECHNSTFNVTDNIFNSERKLLTAWKWTLAFQCLVLVGTRGTEKIRQKVVKAGILPIIATVLDNYLSLHERTFIHANSRQQQQQQQHQTRGNTVNPENIINDTGNLGTDTGNTAEFVNAIRTAQNNANFPFSQTAAPAFDYNSLQIPIQMATAAIEATSISNTHTYPSYFNNSHTNSLTSDDYDSLTVDQLLKLIRLNNFVPNYDTNSSQGLSAGHSNSGNYNTGSPFGSINPSSKNNTINNDIRRRYIIVNIIKKLRDEKRTEILDDRFFNDCDYDMDNNLQFLSDLYLQDFETNRSMISSKIAVRNFTETGVVIPRDDDIVWSLQLLAYISKYPYLKDVLQNTHLVIDMSIRDKQLKLYLEKQMKLKLKKSLAINLRPTITPKSRTTKTTYLERFNPSASNSPQMLNDINTIHDDNFILDEDKFELCNKPEESGLTETAEIEDEDESEEGDDDDDESEEGDDSDKNVNELSSSNEILEHDAELANLAIDSINSSNYLSKLYDSIVDCESIVNDLEREIALFQINEKMNKFIEIESKKLVNTIISKRKETAEFLTKKWSYDDYEHFDIDESNDDQDDSLIEYRKVNLFPIVEKFTFLAGTDMYYWSGVIMRNSCRRNELRGGVRQCGNLECGRWEKFPREFSKCRRCKRTKYCSRECQMRAWHCHRNWCIPSTSSTNTSSQPTGTDLLQGPDEDQESQQEHESS
ncbi:uncharacterized protein RJT20DRAFT_144010 [Scheffersomyces xylosifermentans]|uniref:uncharacterized protein n=1 Tax=Scheffersomyces xylosifermentans TaxID=1304137 RepID=UPI00315C5EC8